MEQLPNALKLYRKGTGNNYVNAMSHQTHSWFPRFHGSSMPMKKLKHQQAAYQALCLEALPRWPDSNSGPKMVGSMVGYGIVAHRSLHRSLGTFFFRGEKHSIWRHKRLADLAASPQKTTICKSTDNILRKQRFRNKNIGACKTLETNRRNCIRIHSRNQMLWNWICLNFAQCRHEIKGSRGLTCHKSKQPVKSNQSGKELIYVSFAGDCEGRMSVQVVLKILGRHGTPFTP